MKESSVDEDRALRDTGGEQMAHTNETLCVCVSVKPLWAATPSLHQRIYSSQPTEISLTAAKQHGGCTKSEHLELRPFRILSFVIYYKYIQIFYKNFFNSLLVHVYLYFVFLFSCTTL